MNDKKRRLRRLERAANGDEVRVVVYWGHEERLERKPGRKVILLTWPKDDGEAATKPRRTQDDFYSGVWCP